jgi:HAE1 family hydrophobic/amphiphilic exporter-1
LNQVITDLAPWSANLRRWKAPRLRLRTIIMTSFAVILGCLPLWTASGSGAVARRVMGTTVNRRNADRDLPHPLTYYVVERFADRRGERAAQDAVRAGANEWKR